MSSTGKSNLLEKGLFTGRVWTCKDLPSIELLESMRMNWPCHDFSPSEQLLILLASRKITTPAELEQFFYPKKENLHDPMLLEDMEKAATRILKAVANSEKVAVHGDFDVDGLTGTALLAQTVSALTVDGKKADLQKPFVPDRIIDGYGVAQRMVKKWAEDSVNLLVTIDTGSSAVAEINLASELGIDCVILDHHLFDKRPDGAHAVVNTRSANNKYPNSELCGVAVGFKLVQALRKLDADCLPSGFENEVIDLAALGLVSDQMDLQGENRAIVKWGMEKVRSHRRVRPGVKALFDVANLEIGIASTTDIAYQIAPRLNACGRIGDVQVALDLLSQGESDFKDLALKANKLNLKRREKDMDLRKQAELMAVEFVNKGDIGLVLGSEEWHRGLVGIGASRMVELYNVPSILFSFEKGEARGSARSITGIDIKSVLDECSDHLLRYGGHAMAAGLTLKCGDIDDFRSAFLKALKTASTDSIVEQNYDIYLSSSQMSGDYLSSLLNEMEKLEPFGEGNRRPLFRCNRLRMKRPPIFLGKTKEHLKFYFSGIDRELICFGHGKSWREVMDKMEDRNTLLEKEWDILFQLLPNKWQPRNGQAADPVQVQMTDITLRQS